MYIVIIIVAIVLMILRGILTRNMMKQSEDEARELMRDKEDQNDRNRKE